MVRTSVDERLVLIYGMYRNMFAATNVCDSRPLAKFASNGEQTLMDLQYVTTQYPNVLLLLLLLLVCVSFTIIGQPRNSVLIRRV